MSWHWFDVLLRTTFYNCNVVLLAFNLPACAFFALSVKNSQTTAEEKEIILLKTN